MNQVVYKLVSVVVSLLAGVLAGAIFSRLWKLAARQDDAPSATDADRGWLEILPAAALEGAVSAVVRAAVDRGVAQGTHKLTGTWPGENGEQAKNAA